MSAVVVGLARRRKVDQHETPSQLYEHERFVRRYGRQGCAPRCVAQAGYGAQMGFTLVHAPCAECAPIVATFPILKANGWHAILVRPRQDVAAAGVGQTLPLVWGDVRAHSDAATRPGADSRQGVAA